MLFTEQEVKALTSKILSMTTAGDASAGVGSNKQSHLRFAANNVLTSGMRETRNANVVVWIDGKRGSASTNDLDDASLKAMVEQAEKIARNAPRDREYMPTLGKQTYKPVNSYFEATANLSLVDRAKQIGAIINELEKNNVIGAGFHSASAQAGGNATKNGNFEYERSTGVGLSVTSRTPDGQSSGYFLRSHNDISKLDTMRIAKESIRKALDGRGARAIEPGIYTVILEPQAVADLIGGFGFGFNARSADEGRSPFSAPGGKTKLGEKVFDEKVTIYSDPWHPDLPGSQSAQGGIPAQRITMINKGVLENLTYNRYWAAQKDRQPTPGPVNTIFETSGPTHTIEEMIKSTPRGILVGRFWYIRTTDPRTASSTGLTRDGVWWIENGKIAYPLKNFRFNQSTVKMLGPGNVLMVGKPERVGSSEGGGGSLLPALKLREFNFTSQSEAV
ncbi:MAG TPA: TldD/PmbA family protein [Pyrinomonadaceae bacterium]|jgi:predicted Zn-dependent protease|nr:TldD/PmbA family protein [Pyrinomonadaceae bacterium]